MLFRLTMTAMQFNATVGYSHYCCITIVVAVKPWALTSGNSTSRRHMYCILSDDMPPTNCKDQGGKWIGWIRRRVSAGWYMDLSTSSQQVSLTTFCTAQRCAFAGKDHGFHSPLLHLLYHRKSRPQQQSADATVQKDSLAPLLTNCWRAMSDAATCPHWIPLFLQGFQSLDGPFSFQTKIFWVSHQQFD